MKAYIDTGIARGAEGVGIDFYVKFYPPHTTKRDLATLFSNAPYQIQEKLFLALEGLLGP